MVTSDIGVFCQGSFVLDLHETIHIFFIGDASVRLYIINGIFQNKIMKSKRVLYFRSQPPIADPRILLAHQLPCDPCYELHLVNNTARGAGF